ncbi:MAG: XRE family transcriptional regulator [Chloroflexi bacterium]|nr:XRE family transcriptional regulator [Chloroflexota bacterium]
MSDNLFLGKRLNKRRTELNLSLRDLAEKTDLTASFLSQLERGIVNSSLKSLQKIADALNVPLLYFLAENPSQSPVVRADSRSKLDLDDDRVSYELLTPDLTGKFEAVIGHIKSGCENIARPLNVETEEFIFVLEGSLTVGLKEREYILNEGDSIYFNGSDLVKLTSACETETRWISVITPPVF